MHVHSILVQYIITATCTYTPSNICVTAVRQRITIQRYDEVHCTVPGRFNLQRKRNLLFLRKRCAETIYYKQHFADRPYTNRIVHEMKIFVVALLAFK